MSGQLTSKSDNHLPIVRFTLIYRIGLPMSVFSTLGIAANGVGAVAAGWVEMDKRLGWKWIQWIHFMYEHARKPYLELIPFLQNH